MTGSMEELDHEIAPGFWMNESTMVIRRGITDTLIPWLLSREMAERFRTCRRNRIVLKSGGKETRRAARRIGRSQNLRNARRAMREQVGMKLNGHEEGRAGRQYGTGQGGLDMANLAIFVIMRGRCARSGVPMGILLMGRFGCKGRQAGVIMQARKRGKDCGG